MAQRLAALIRGGIIGAVIICGTRIHPFACQTPVQGQQANTGELKLTPEEEKDSYDIYSMLLIQTAPPGSDKKIWLIEQKTAIYPRDSSAACIEPLAEQNPVYIPAMKDYVVKNREQLPLIRKFNLPAYDLIEHSSEFPNRRDLVFQVSAVGFNKDRTRVLVYVGHVCGPTCGGGTYHFLMKKNGHWQTDPNFRGTSCGWAS